MQNSVADRLKKLIEILGINLKEFSARTGIPYRTLQAYLKGEIIPGGENLQKIAAVFCVNLNWLLTGEGEMFIKKPYHVEKEEESRAFAEEIGAMYVKPVPVLGYVPAGFPSEIPDDAIIEWVTLPDIPEGSFVFIAHGDSMSPVIRDGDYVVVHPNREIVSGNIVMYQNEWGEVSIKRFRRKNDKIFFVPENPEYPIIEYNPEKHRILGKVIKAFRPIKLE